MMRSIFLCNEDTINFVYTKEAIEFLGENAGLENKIYRAGDLKSGRFKDVEYIFTTWNMPALSEEELEKYLPSLKAVFYAAGTVQYFARPFLNRGIKVFSAWAANALPVAEYSVAQIILAGKNFYRAVNANSTGGLKEAHNERGRVAGNYKNKVGIIGAGMIGSAVVEKLRKITDLNVLVFDAFLSAERIEALGGKKASLEEIFKSCSVISNHLANNEQTKGMLHYDLFKLMSDNATFINTGRGAQVIEDDLVRALNEEKSRIAILDVTDPEPCKEGHPFFKMPNVFLTPHIAGSMGTECYRLADFMVEEFVSLTNNKATRYEVTPKMLETMA